MTDIKLSQLPSAALPSGSEILPMVQNNRTVGVTVSQLLYRAAAAEGSGLNGTPIYMYAGDGDGYGNGGWLTLEAGRTTYLGYRGGGIDITAGDSYNIGGGIYMTAGEGGVDKNSEGGYIGLYGGRYNNGGGLAIRPGGGYNGGTLYLYGGQAYNNNAGHIFITGGYSRYERSGNVYITGGYASNAPGGNVTIRPGYSDGNGRGWIYLNGLPTDNSGPTGSLWNDSGTIKIIPAPG